MVAAEQPPVRQVRLVLCTPDGRVLGVLPAYDVAVPWWQEVRDVVLGARDRHGVDVTVLRTLGGAGGVPVGGAVTYLAEVASAPDGPLLPWSGDPSIDEPLRLPYALPGGPAADLAWADGVLMARGTPRTAPAEQMRTWNLSSLWRLPMEAGAAWLKVVPPFFAHEGAMLSRLDGAVVPPLLASDGGRVLLAEVPGEDWYDATGPMLLRMVRLLVDVQLQWIDRLDELLALGLPDWRAQPLQELAEQTLAAARGSLDAATLSAAAALVDTLPERFRAVAACGIPDSLVHGDFHPGNVHGTEERLVLLDWGDCGIGHPLLDQVAFGQRQSESDRAAVRAEWARLWRAAVPGCDPERAAALLEPAAALRQAVIYRKFLDNIEPMERVYHARDPERWLRRAVSVADTTS